MSGPRDLLVIFAKPAVAGAVKTRLIPTLTPEQAAALHLAALDDTVERATARLDVPIEIFLSADGGARAEFERRYPGCAVRLQRGAGLGERLAAAFGDAFERDHERVLVLGSDHPTLPIESLDRAFTLLESAQVVLGPSRDGGYYLVGVRAESWPRAAALFEEIAWSTAEVLEQTMDRARRAALTAALLPEWYDVDRPEDLRRLAGDAARGSNVARLLRDLRLP